MTRRTGVQLTYPQQSVLEPIIKAAVYCQNPTDPKDEQIWPFHAGQDDRTIMLEYTKRTGEDFSTRLNSVRKFRQDLTGPSTPSKTTVANRTKRLAALAAKQAALVTPPLAAPAPVTPPQTTTSQMQEWRYRMETRLGHIEDRMVAMVQALHRLTELQTTRVVNIETKLDLILGVLESYTAPKPEPKHANGHDAPALAAPPRAFT